MRRHGKTLVGIVLSLLLLAWVLRDVSLASVADEVRAADPVLFVAAIALTLGGFVFRAIRWGVLLSPVVPGLAFRPRFAATMIGFAANNVLPARVGEFARAISLARIGAVPMAASFATLVVERIFDGLAVVGLLFAAMASSGFPARGDIAGIDPRAAARMVALVMGAVGVLLFLLVIFPERSVRVAERVAGRILPVRLRRPVVAALESFLVGLAVLRSGRLFTLSLALAVAQWLFTGLSFLLAFRAFGIDQVPFSGALFLQSLIALAVAIPSSPGFFGPFEAGAKFGLHLWGVAAEKAVSFAVGFHIGGFVPVTVIGFYYVWRLNLSWRDVQHSEETLEDRLEGKPVLVIPENR